MEYGTEAMTLSIELARAKVSVMVWMAACVVVVVGGEGLGSWNGMYALVDIILCSADDF